MKTREHHNNKGYRQIRNGRTRKDAAILNAKYADSEVETVDALREMGIDGAEYNLDLMDIGCK